MKVLVTGANGFLGQSVWKCLNATHGVDAVGTVRHTSAFTGVASSIVAVGDLSDQTDWEVAMDGVDAVVHTAARVHVMDDSETDPLAEFRRVNVQGTLRLARQAAATNVRRFVFVSSVKVNGEASQLEKPFTASDTPAPLDPYGVSKMEAEQGLRKIADETGMEVVIIRPPLVYGPSVRANFLRLMQFVARGIPLPFGQVDNRRSLVALDNLVELLILCVDHPAATGKTFLVSDGHDLSTPNLIRGLAKAMGRPARLFPVPTNLLRLSGLLTGKSAEVDRLVGSLQVDIRHTCETLDWSPPVTVEEGLRRAVQGMRG